jgi:hypothetical protein
VHGETKMADVLPCYKWRMIRLMLGCGCTYYFTIDLTHLGALRFKNKKCCGYRFLLPALKAKTLKRKMMCSSTYGWLIK